MNKDTHLKPSELIKGEKYWYHTTCKVLKVKYRKHGYPLNESKIKRQKYYYFDLMDKSNTYIMLNKDGLNNIRKTKKIDHFFK